MHDPMSSLSILKISALSILSMYSVQAQSNSQQHFLVEFDKLILKCTWKRKYRM